MTTTTRRIDVYRHVTETLLAALEAGIRPWFQPWASGHHQAGPISRPLRHNGTAYKGINTLMLWWAAMEAGYTAPYWMTYKQAQELGGQVRKGEHGTLVVFANAMTKTETDAKTGEDVEIEIPYMKGYTVFNVEQIDGLPERFYARVEKQPTDENQRHAQFDAFFKATGADIRHGGHRAFYHVKEDFIQMPPFSTFYQVEGYYTTLAHETAHWTRHPSRLAREFGQQRWGDAAYAMEELVAEITSAFIGAEMGIAPQVMEDHAAYIGSWLKVLQADKKAIFTAASYAQKAADFLLASWEAEQQPEQVALAA